MKARDKDIGFAIFLLVGGVLVIVLWACSPLAQSTGPSRIEWPVPP